MDQETHERNWAEAETWLEDQKNALRTYYWKAAGRPWGTDSYLPEELR